MAGPLERVLSRGPAHVVGTHADGLVYAFFASSEGAEAFGHKHLFALRGLLNIAPKSVDIGHSYIGCHFEDIECRGLVRRKAESAEHVVAFGRALLDACTTLHERALFHGAISADRVFLSDECGLIVRDCGVISATLMNIQGAISPQTSGFDRIFPPNATIPAELLSGDACSSQTDIFLIGALLYQLLSGRRPFSAPSTLSCYRRIVEGDFDSLDIESEELKGWIHQSLQASPAARPKPQESIALFQQLNAGTSYDELFEFDSVALSETLTGGNLPTFSEPFLVSDPHESSALKVWDAQLTAQKNRQRTTPANPRWGSWLAIAFIAIVTWIFIEMGSAEMRSRSYDGRPGPAPQENVLGDRDESNRLSRIQRRPAEKGRRLPRQSIDL